MNKLKIVRLLGLAMRASKLVTGEELTLKDIRKGKTRFLFIASDASQNTKKKLKDKCSYYTVAYDETFSQEELSLAIGKVRKVIGVNDQGFSDKFRELLNG